MRFFFENDLKKCQNINIVVFCVCESCLFLVYNRKVGIMATTCPYCNIEVRESAIEAEDGCCPECGAQISGVRSLLDDPDGDYYDYEDDENDDIYSVLDDDEDDGHDFSRRDLDDDDIFGDDGFDDDLDAELVGEMFDELEDGEFDDFDDEDFDEEFDEEEQDKDL